MHFNFTKNLAKALIVLEIALETTFFKVRLIVIKIIYKATRPPRIVFEEN